MRPGGEAIGDQGAGNRVAALLDLGIRADCIAIDHARFVMRHARTAIKEVDHPHRPDQLRMVSSSSSERNCTSGRLASFISRDTCSNSGEDSVG